MDSEICSHLDKMARGIVEEALRTTLDVEAGETGRARRYERSPDGVGTRVGRYIRKRYSKVHEVEVKMPKPRRRTFRS